MLRLAFEAAILLAVGEKYTVTEDRQTQAYWWVCRRAVLWVAGCAVKCVHA